MIKSVWKTYFINSLRTFNYKYKNIGNRELSILRDMPNVLLTPHMAFYTEQAISDMVKHSITSIFLKRVLNH